MKHAIIKYLLPLCFLAGNVFATEMDSLNVRLLVQKQFEAARSKQAEQVQVKEKVPVEKPFVLNKPIELHNESEAGVSNSLLYRILFILIAGSAIGIFVAYNRKKKKLASNKIVLKKNIQMMRQEKFIKRIDPRLKEIRTNLCLTSSQLNGKPAMLSAAKKLKIGKEELAIASRIKHYEQQFNYDRSVV